MILTSPPLQGFFFRETDFYFCQFLSNFLRYSSSNFPSFHPYNIFTIYFSSNSPFLKSLSSAMSNFFCHLTFAFILPLNSATTSFVFSKSFSLSQESCSAINSFHHTRYFITPHIFLLLKIVPYTVLLDIYY